MNDLQRIDNELKQMRAQMQGTVDINYERYNTEFMGKVEKYNLLRKQGLKANSDSTLKSAIEDGANTLHHQAKGRTFNY